MSNKTIFDRIWGNCEFDEYFFQFIDTYEFQRMRNMKQLGSSYFVFSSASGNRFEHSIGVGYLAMILGNILNIKYPEIVNKTHVRLLTLAGLIHDIGHGPYSHLFDKIKPLGTDDNDWINNHEERSKMIFKYMINKYGIKIPEYEVEIVFNMIDPKEEHKRYWLYQIISGEIDVDRLDYILRDSSNVGHSITFNHFQAIRIINKIEIKNEQIYFPSCLNNDIEDFFRSRAIMYSRVYRSPKVLELDAKVSEIFNLSKIKEIIKTIEDFIKFDDSILFQLYSDDFIKPYLDEFFGRRN